MNPVPQRRRQNSNSKPLPTPWIRTGNLGTVNQVHPCQTNICKSEPPWKQESVQGIRAKSSLTRKTWMGAKKPDNKQNTKGLCIEKKGNDWLKHYESQQKWGKHWCNLNKTAKTELRGNLQSSPRPGEHKHTLEAVGSLPSVWKGSDGNTLLW